jgi:hypothetical protein
VFSQVTTFLIWLPAHSQSGKLLPAAQSDVVVAVDNNIPEYVVIAMGTSGQKVREMTIHKPVGITKMASDDWVISTKENLQFLLTRVNNPNKEKLLASRREMTLKLASAEPDKSGIAVDNGTWLYKTSKKNRHEALQAARAAHKEAMQKIDSKSEEKPSDIDFLSEMDRKDETIFRTYAAHEDVKKRVEAACLDTYLTNGGPLADQPQVAVPILKGLAASQVEDAVFRLLFTFPVPKNE